MKILTNINLNQNEIENNAPLDLTGGGTGSDTIGQSVGLITYGNNGYSLQTLGTYSPGFLYSSGGGKNLPEWKNIDAYVIESGVSGIWEYKKWSDGTKECYACTTALSYGTGTSWIGGYYHLTSYIAFPSGLFANSPRVVATEADAVLTMVVGTLTYTDRVAFYIFNGNSGVGDVDLNIHAMGT